MLGQIIPIKKKLPIGSQKLFAHRYQAIEKIINVKKIKEYMITLSKSAFKVSILWILLIATIGLLYYNDIINSSIVFIIAVFFYMCDLICVLIWCPFRLIMKNKCCTTCRIFNWDHLMMFSPLIFISGFYSLSLFFLSLLVWVIWEIYVLIYPERFIEVTNVNLKCSECTNKLCTQYSKN